MGDPQQESAPVCPSCRQPDPECDCPVEYVNEYKPHVKDRADEDVDEDAFGW
jgi:hypothetical protein